MDIKNFALRIPTQQYKKVVDISASMGISRNALIVIALNKYIKQLQKSRSKALNNRSIAFQISTARKELNILESKYKQENKKLNEDK